MPNPHTTIAAIHVTHTGDTWTATCHHRDCTFTHTAPSRLLADVAAHHHQRAHVSRAHTDLGYGDHR